MTLWTFLPLQAYDHQLTMILSHRFLRRSLLPNPLPRLKIQHHNPLSPPFLLQQLHQLLLSYLLHQQQNHPPFLLTNPPPTTLTFTTNS